MNRIAYTLLVIATLTGLVYFGIKNIDHSQRPVDPQNLQSEYQPSLNLAVFHRNVIGVPPAKDSQTAVLGESSPTQEKIIKIDLSEQKLYAYEGDKRVMTFDISSGKWSPTPTGEFNVWIKLRYTLMTGGNKAWGTYYYLPNVPYVMYFYNDEVPKQRGYGIHGAYWHNNFGNPMSHGCVNMDPEDAGEIFNWSPDGVKVIIYGEAPKT